MDNMKKILRRAAGKAKRKARATLFGPKEEGFAIVVVLVALTLLSVLGAASLLLMVSSLQGVVNTKPEDRAFQITETGLYAAHAMIVNDAIPSAEDQPVEDEAFGGTYKYWIEQIDSFTYSVTSEGKYVSQGREYRRKIREEVYYSGPQAFDVLRNYVVFAGNDINFLSAEGLSLSSFTINGNMRAEHDVNFDYYNAFLSGSSFTLNGNLEARNRVNINVGSLLIAAATANFFGDIKTGYIPDGTMGDVSLAVYPVFLAISTINAATDGHSIYADDIQETYGGFLGGGYINTGTHVRDSGCEEVYIPKPNYEYYKALAKEQGNFFEGNKTLSGNLGTYASSSVTVIYCTGNLTLNGFAWNQPGMKGILVCEGDFTGNDYLQFSESSQFQVIAKGNATFNNRFDFDHSSTCKFFMYSDQDVTVNLGLFAGEYCQITALNDVNINRGAVFLSNCSLNYLPPDIDVVGFPVELTVSDWRELPSEE